MKKSKIVFKIFFIIIIIALFVPNASNAGDGIFDQGSTWIRKGSGGNVNLAEATEGFQNIAGVLWGIGVFAVVIAGAVIGIRYMLGSVEEKAEHKKLLIPYLVGSIIIFGALGIWQLFIEIGNSAI